MSTNIDPERIQATIDFHGHWCPGLAIGIRAAEWALKEMGGKAEDEEIVAVVETDMCGVDAIQYLIGCTYGKGNLIHRDYGKNAFNFYRRRDDKAARIVAKPGIYGESQQTLGRLHGKMMTEGLTDEEYAEWERIRAEISSITSWIPIWVTCSKSRNPRGRSPKRPAFCPAWSAKPAANPSWNPAPGVSMKNTCAFPASRTWKSECNYKDITPPSIKYRQEAARWL